MTNRSLPGSKWVVFRRESSKGVAQTILTRRARTRRCDDEHVIAFENGAHDLAKNL
jgi:hypothetical protein